MPKDTKKDVATDAAPEVAVAETPPAEPVYTRAEFVQQARAVFGIHRDIVEAALISAKVGSCTISEAKVIVKRFAERKV